MAQNTHLYICCEYAIRRHAHSCTLNTYGLTRGAQKYLLNGTGEICLTCNLFVHLSQVEKMKKKEAESEALGHTLIHSLTEKKSEWEKVQ